MACMYVCMGWHVIYLWKEFSPGNFDCHGADLDAVHDLHDLHVDGLLEALRVNVARPGAGDGHIQG